LIYKDIFIAFFRSGLLCYGGGPASIPLLHKEVVDIYKWMDTETFGEVVALGNTLPGPINPKIAGYVGYRVGGALGCAIALGATAIPTVILMIVLLTTLSQFQHFTWVQGMTRAMMPVVAVMLGVMAVQFLQAASKGLKWPIIIAHVLITFSLIWFLNVHPAIIIAALLLWALFGQSFQSLFHRKGKGSQS